MLGLLGVGSLLAVGCSDGAETTGRRIVLDTMMTAGPEATQPFTTSQGWTISLSKILISTGPLYYFDGAVIFSRLEPPSNPTYEFLERYIGIRSAHAHPGHYVPGNARGEVLVGTTVDLHDGPVQLATGEGVTGLVRSATFSFGASPAGPLAAELGSNVMVVEGTATRGEATRTFRAELATSDLINTKKIPAIEGCPFDTTTMEFDGVVTITVRVPYWFDQVEFDELPAGLAADPTVMPVSSIARNELVRGMKAGDAYLFSYSKK
ncbi:MAG: hypothetical protein ABW133_18345 [Polyangiaceae bacterium]